MMTRKRLFLLLSLFFSVIVPLYTFLSGDVFLTVYVFIGPPIQILSVVMFVEFFMYNSDEDWPKFRTILILTALLNLIFWGDLGIFIMLTGGFLIIILHVTCSYFAASMIKNAIYRMKEPSNIMQINPTVKKVLLVCSFIITFGSFLWMIITGETLQFSGSGWL